MIIRCSCCAKQAINRYVSRFDKYCTILDGAKADFNNQVICGYCAKDLDEYGLFPEERSMLTEEERWLMYPNERWKTYQIMSPASIYTQSPDNQRSGQKTSRQAIKNSWISRRFGLLCQYRRKMWQRNLTHENIGDYELEILNKESTLEHAKLYDQYKND